MQLCENEGWWRRLLLVRFSKEPKSETLSQFDLLNVILTMNCLCLRQQTMPSAIFSFDKCWLVWIFSAQGHYLTKSSKWTPFKTIDKFIPDFNSMSLTRPSISVNQEFIQLCSTNLQFIIRKWSLKNISIKSFPFAINIARWSPRVKRFKRIQAPINFQDNKVQTGHCTMG